MLKLAQDKDAEAVILGTASPTRAATNFGCIVSDAHTKRVLHYVEKPESRISNLINCGRRLDRPARLLSYPSSDNLETSYLHAQAADDDDDDEEGRKTEVIRLEQDILGDMADSKQFFVYETRTSGARSRRPAPPSPPRPLPPARPPVRQRGARPAQRQHRAPRLHPPHRRHPPHRQARPQRQHRPRAVVGAGARIKESIVLEDTEVKHDSCVLYSIIGWGSRVGAWARVEGTPIPVTTHSTSIIKNGVKVQSITILGKDCGVGDEVRVQNCDVANEVIM
ncbi:unnamed protein product [Clonostachys rosea f. rosea IK726]|uniref:Uncharacterized protein n=1 Tax=Clonostachys rosea f. rosea IK726 TaxID=1349383 RepID=A0ACA9U8P7_BIOOC|nr:unnamed protein product [Clonostachys rosea f. rosea IK726]